MDYSMVICAYNPDTRLLERCLTAVYDLQRDHLATEVILVDNNSRVPVSSLPCVQAYLKKIPAMRLLHVKEQGVKYARMAAIAAARGKYTIYFDYDNEPAADYLLQLEKLHTAYPQVAAWGPGHIWVDFIDGVRGNIENYARKAFQERHDTQTAFASVRNWQDCYPFGTGLCTDTFLLKEYVALARQGRFSLSGRKGDQPSSGEDTQMILLCVSKGYAAGVSPALKLKHMISASRANYQYLLRLAYGTSVCYQTCLLEIFPEYTRELQQKIMPRAKFIRKTLKKLLVAKWSRDLHKTFDLVYFIGFNAGAYLALNKPVPAPVARIIRYLKVT